MRESVILEAKRNRRVWMVRSNILLGMLAFSALGLFIVYIFTQKPELVAAKVTLRGITGNEAEAILRGFRKDAETSFVGKLFGGSNYFAWTSDIGEGILSVENIEIKKSLLQREIEINITPRNSGGIWCSSRIGEGEPGEWCGWFDSEDGTIFREIPASDGQLIFTVHEQNSPLIGLGEKVLNEESLKNLKAAFAIVRNIQEPVVYLTFSREHEELTATMRGGARLLFSTRFDPGVNAAGLEQIRKEVSFLKLDYVDLTVPNKVYVKRR